MVPSVVEGGMPSWHAMDDAMPLQRISAAINALDAPELHNALTEYRDLMERSEISLQHIFIIIFFDMLEHRFQRFGNWQKWDGRMRESCYWRD